MIIKHEVKLKLKLALPSLSAKSYCSVCTLGICPTKLQHILYDWFNNWLLLINNNGNFLCGIRFEYISDLKRFIPFDCKWLKRTRLCKSLLVFDSKAAAIQHTEQIFHVVKQLFKQFTPLNFSSRITAFSKISDKFERKTRYKNSNWCL